VAPFLSQALPVPPAIPLIDEEELMDTDGCLAFDRDHADRCHERWRLKLNRRMGTPEYKDSWLLEQCFNCRFYIPLTGEFEADYGACSNENSLFDRYVMFEHDGCEKHERVDEL
jgi:hypothetical protein